MADQTKWLTYEEAAQALGISAEAVRARARRHAWPRKRGGDGRALLELPAAAAADSVRKDAPAAASRTAGPSLDRRLLEAIELLARTFRDQLALVRADLHSVRAELAEERRIAREAALAYRRIAEELSALRKARASAPDLAETLRELRRARAQEEPPALAEPAGSRAFNQAEHVDRLAAIRRRIEETLQTRH